MLGTIVRTALVAGIASTIVGPAVAVPQDAGIVTTTNDQRSKRIETFLDGYVKGDFAAADTLFKPDTGFYWADMSEAMSLDGWREAVAMQHKAFRDFKLMNRVIVTTEYPEYGPWTYVWTNWQATSKATGQPLDLPLHLMYRWDGDRVADEFAYFDKGRFEEVFADTMARLEPSEAPCPWDWVLGHWKVTGGPLPDGLVNWTMIDGKQDFILGEWTDADGVRSMQVGGWDPSTGLISFDTFGSDGSSSTMVMNEFPSKTLMAGTFRTRTPDGTIGGGRMEVERTAEDRMAVRFFDTDGTKMERIFTPTTADEPMRMSLSPAVRAGDWRTKAVDGVHAAYAAGDFASVGKPFSKDCMHHWGDMRNPASNADWQKGLAMHHQVFKDITLEGLYSMTGEYPDGETWTVSWFNWTGTDRRTGEKAEFLVHCGFRWDGDQIVEERAFFDADRFRKHVEAAGMG
ncbi:MAG: hypothetical protein VX672_07525 [Planctomycetota bacterium]|nr:hypothetical protein [Planctomycetota bacterium]